MVLEVEESTNRLKMARRSGGRNQTWQFDKEKEDGTVSNSIGLCLDIKGKGKDAEVVVQQRHGCKNQAFRRVYLTRAD